MKVKRFFAPDMRRAIQLVRSEHGPDAVILSSRSVEGGIEIISALDYDESLVAQVARQAEPTRADAPLLPQASADVLSGLQPAGKPGGEPGGKPDGKPTAADDVRWSQDPMLRTMQEDISTLKGMLREQFAQLAWADLKNFQPERAALRRRADALGLEPGLADALAAEVKRTHDPVRAWRDLVLALARRIRVHKSDPIDEGGVIALVGPTGVGKTTTIAKLAARHCLRHGGESLALVSTDNYRVGAQRQLDAFGAILGVPVRRADSRADLEELLGRLSDRRLVLVDTAGLGPRDGRLAEAQEAVAMTGVRRFVVLAANMQASAMRAAVRRFGGAELSGAVLTKLDETDGLGAALSVLIGERLAAAWLSQGQRVPEDLMMARVLHLIDWAVQPPGAAEEPPRAAPRATAEVLSHVA